MLEIGTAVRDITVVKHGVGMMGWAHHGNHVEGVESPLHARAFVFKSESGRKLAFVSAEIAFVSAAVKQGVVERLQSRYPEGGFTDANVMLSATHTHSGPGGYSHHVFYNMHVPGFVPEVYEGIVEGIVGAIAEADARAKPGRMFAGRGAVHPDAEVAFNRSLEAHNANRDVRVKYAPQERHLAVDREMHVLRLEGLNGEPYGAISWFSTHNTSVHNENRLISSDNKGVAARLFESHMREPFVAAFAQGAAGDVTPNFRFHAGLEGARGKFRDDFESSRYVGEHQYQHAQVLHGMAALTPPLAEELDAVLMYVDMSDVTVSPAFAHGREAVRTAPAAIGARMLEGTAEGRGIPPFAGALAKVLAEALGAQAVVRAALTAGPEGRRVLAKYRAQAPKALFMETNEGIVLGTTDLKNLVLPDWSDPTVRYLKRLAAEDALGSTPWTPHVLPLQLFLLGPVAIAAVPAEFTTQAGRRLRWTLENALAARGVTHVILTCYANAYSGYVTTPEEYVLQAYEGASTHFGRHTLGAYQTKFIELVRELARQPAERQTPGPVPQPFPPEALAALSHSRALEMMA